MTSSVTNAQKRKKRPFFKTMFYLGILKLLIFFFPYFCKCCKKGVFLRFCARDHPLPTWHVGSLEPFLRKNLPTWRIIFVKKHIKT